MKKHLGVLLACVCAFALCLGLAACGGSGSTNKADYAGTWSLTGLVEDGEETSQEDLDLLASMGLEVFLNLNEDGTMAFVLFGEPLDGTWDITGDNQLGITMEGETTTATVEGGTLTMEQDGSKMTFTKGEAKEVPAASEDIDEDATEEEEEVPAVPGTPATVASATDFPGTWDIVELTEAPDEAPLSTDDLNETRSMGMDLFLNLNDDNTFELYMYYLGLRGTWTADSDSQLTLTVGEESFPLEIVDSKMTWVYDGVTIVFGKVADKKEIPADTDYLDSLGEFLGTEEEATEEIELTGEVEGETVEAAEGTEAEAAGGAEAEVADEGAQAEAAVEAEEAGE